MTMPSERTRAMRWAYEILVELHARQDVPEDLRHQAWMTLRHYPDQRTIDWMARDGGCADFLALEDSDG